MAEDKKETEAQDLGMKGEGRHPTADESGKERRREPRVLLNIEVDYSSEDTFLFAYITDMSNRGIFIHTNTPEPIGTLLNLDFALPGEEGRLAVEGEVMWVNTFRPGDFENINPGMGVRFTEIEDDQQRQITKLVQRIAYLEDTADPNSAEPTKIES